MTSLQAGQIVSFQNYLSPTPGTAIQASRIDGNISDNTGFNITSSSDCNIFPVNKTINPTNYIYDGQTNLYVNSINQNANTSQGQYFDPSSPNPSAGWSYNFNAYNPLNASFAYSSILNDNIVFQNTTNNTAPVFYNLDLTNNSNPNSTKDRACFLSLTSNPYTNYFPLGSPPSTPVNEPTIRNINPFYNAPGDNYLFTSNYFIPQLNEVLVCEVIFSISNSSSTNVNNVSPLLNYPTVSCIIKNKIISQEVIANLDNGDLLNPKIKTYTAGPIPISYTQNGEQFNPTTFSFNTNNNIPLVIAPGYQKVYMTTTCMFVPPYSANGVYYGQYLRGQYNSEPSGYSVKDGVITVNPSTGLVKLSQDSGNVTQFGHFCIGIAYSSDYLKYSSYLQSGIQAEVLVKNTWRSPISLFNTYKSYSITDMATKQVVVLFGTGTNGGVFLVTNTGTPVALINNYAVTSLRNFISIMRAIIHTYDGSVPIVEYFINPSVIQTINTGTNYSIQVLIMQPLLDGSIVNPPTVLSCPGMNYFLLNSKNSANFSLDPYEQSVFSQEFSLNGSVPYLGQSGSILCSLGNCKYGASDIKTLSTDVLSVFGNALYLGQRVINNQNYYCVALLPESQFNPHQTVPVTSLNVYSTFTSIFYIMSSITSGSQFTSATSISSKSTTSSYSITPGLGVSKITITVSNIPLITNTPGN
jgi:hypothetical protein